MKKHTITFIFISACFAPAFSQAAVWQLGPCGRSGLCPGQYTPIPTPTAAPTPDPLAPPPTPWPTPTATPAPISGAFVKKVDVGADSALVDPQSQAWAQDQAYVPAAYGHVGASGAYGSSAPVDLALAPGLYQTLRQDTALQYRVAVPENGSYRVTLHFAEFVAQAPGERVMSVSMEGVVEAAALDVLALAGPARAYTLSRDLAITDGVVDISLQATAGKAMLAAVEVTGLQAQGAPQPTPTPTEPPLTLQLDLPTGARLLSQP